MAAVPGAAKMWFAVGPTNKKVEMGLLAASLELAVAIVVYLVAYLAAIAIPPF